MNELLSSMIASYEIGEITEPEEGKAEAKVDVTFGFDPDKMTNIDINSEAEALAQDYMNENMAELQKIYMEGGQDALMNKVLDDLVGELLDKYVEEVKKTGQVDRASTLTLENKDGKWLITGETF